MKFRLMIVSALMLILVMVPGMTNAQGMDSCFGLSEADCAVISAAEANDFGDITSLTVEYEFELNIEGVPDPTTTSAYVASSGAIDLVENTMATIPLTVGGEATVEFAQGEAAPFSIPIEFRLVDDMVYWLDPFMGTWSGMNLMTLLSDPAFGEQLNSLPVNPMTGDMGPLADLDPEALAGLAGLMDVPGLIVYERDGDDFILTIDLTTLSQLSTDPALADVNASLMSLLEAASPGSGMMVPMILGMTNEAAISLIQTVDTELNMVNHIGIEVNVAVDPTAFTGEQADPITVDMTLDLYLTNLDMAATAEAPADFTEVDPATLLGGGM